MRLSFLLLFVLTIAACSNKRYGHLTVRSNRYTVENKGFIKDSRFNVMNENQDCIKASKPNVVNENLVQPPLAKISQLLPGTKEIKSSQVSLEEQRFKTKSIPTIRFGSMEDKTINEEAYVVVQKRHVVSGSANGAGIVFLLVLIGLLIWVLVKIAPNALAAGLGCSGWVLVLLAIAAISIVAIVAAG